RSASAPDGPPVRPAPNRTTGSAPAPRSAEASGVAPVAPAATERGTRWLVIAVWAMSLVPRRGMWQATQLSSAWRARRAGPAGGRGGRAARWGPGGGGGAGGGGGGGQAVQRGAPPLAA